MPFWTKHNKATDLLKEDTVEELLKDPLMLGYVKTEDFLTVALDIRPCSFLTIPAEVPNASEMGEKIDALCGEDFQTIKAAPVDKKVILIGKMKEKLHETFKAVVYNSDTYRAHLDWIRKLGLQTFDFEVRPTIHELYLFKVSSLKGELRKLMNYRRIERERIVASRAMSETPSRLAYAEELSFDYVTSVGKLLGYPICCTDRYATERVHEGISVEMRASKQIEELKRNNEMPDAYAYFARNFFPCSPNCQNASQIGRKTVEILNSINPRLSSLHFECMRKNLEVVEKYSELIRQFRNKMGNKARKLGAI
jgi:hypothetical protein